LQQDEKVYWLAFSLVPGIGIKRMQKLAGAFGSLAEAWTATDAQLKGAGLETVLRAHLLKTRSTLDLAAQVDKIRRAGASFISLADETYPPMLKSLPDAPPVLYLLGDLLPQDQRAIAVVGTRKATKYGRDVAFDLCEKLAANGVTIISGLAPGIDRAAHEGALKAGGRTIVVLGSGIDRVYPREHDKLAREIANGHGAVISEFPVGTPPEGRNFPRRNRIISGLSLGVLVVEAPANSGALITAHTAAEQGRDVFAVPSSLLNPMGMGTNRLIQDGAKLVMGVEDILSELNISHDNLSHRTVIEQAVSYNTAANDTEALLLTHLSAEPIHIDDLARLCGLPMATVSSTLMLLELKGLAQMVGHMQYNLT
jgi:DNA processing protein